MYQGNYNLAIVNFEIGFEQVDKPHARDFYYTARCYSQLQEVEYMYNYLEKSLSAGFPLKHIITDSLWFTNYRYETRYRTILERDFFIPTHSQDTSLINILNTIWKNTPDYSEVDSIKTYFKTSDIEYKTFFKKRDSILDSNQKLYEEAILQNNLASLINSDVNLISKLSFMYLSTDSKQYDLIIRKFYNALTDGKVSPSFYANIIDRSRQFSGKPILYGLNLNSINEEDFEFIVENRKKIGLSTYYATAPVYRSIYEQPDITYNFITK